jgi:tyrosyl-tRNA synthetase
MFTNSKFLQDFISRGYYSQCTNINFLDQILTNKKITAYIGFDCTARSLHIGSLIQIMILRLLQKHHHQPIVLLGGGTTLIGDPSGKDESRQILSNNQIQQNLDGIHKTLTKFINFSDDKAIFINNIDWLKNINYLEFLRDIGKYFSINRMLSFDSVKLRLDREQPLSFLEFNYMILQAYDFYYLHKNHNCILQIGGSDQWGNIVNGVELIRRMSCLESSDETNSAFGLTTPLLTTADGKKMGKTADGAIWLDEELLSPYEYFQYFRNTHDDDVIKFLKLFTDLSLAQIDELAKLQGNQINSAKEILAFEATKICHGEINANQALQKARSIFINKNNQAFDEKIINLPENNSIKLIDIIFNINATESKSDAKRLISGNAVKINNQNITDLNFSFDKPQEFDLTIGKKQFYKIFLK